MAEHEPSARRGPVEGDSGPGLTLGLIGAVALAGCVPRVSAQLVISEGPPSARTERPPPTRATGPDRVPPIIARAELAGSRGLRIHFSEPVVVAGAIDPSAFRISFLRVQRDSDGPYSYAYYYDPGYLNYGTPTTLGVAQLDGEQLTFELGSELSPNFCRQLEREYYAGPAGEAGLFLHYAAGSIPIVDVAGNQLAEVGPDWVARGRTDPPELRQQFEGVAALRAGAGLVRIACGPPIPPGPR